MKSTLRWIATPFASIIGGAIVYFLVSIWIKGNNYGFQVYNGFEVGNITDIILAICAQAAFGGAFVLCGAIAAPRHQQIVSIVLASLIGFISLASLFFSFANVGFSFMLLLYVAATIVGAITACRYVYKECPQDA